MRDELEKALTPKQHKAIAALISERTHEDAAEAAGISSATLYRWLKEDAFMDAYREATSQAFEGAIRKLHALTPKALEILEEHLVSDEEPAKKVRAVFALLDRGFKGKEQFDLLPRLERVEELLEQRGESGSWRS